MIVGALSTSGKQRSELMLWIFAGGALFIMGLLCWIILASREKYGTTVKNALQNSSLIVSPSGIALIQGDLKGLLRWDEVRKVTIRKKPRFLEVSSRNRRFGELQISISGAEINIPDIYDRPLPLIKKVIYRYWKGEH